MSRTFEELQNLYREIVRRFETIEPREWKAEGAMIELTKQAGELARQVMLMEHYYAFEEDEAAVRTRLGNEMADVIAQLIRLSDYYGIDIEQAFVEARQDEDMYLRERGV